MFTEIKSIALRITPTLGQDLAGGAALVLMLVVGLHVTALT